MIEYLRNMQKATFGDSTLHEAKNENTKTI